MSVRVDADAFRRMLHERCMTGEQLRVALGLSATTLAKFNRGDNVSDDVFLRVVQELENRPVKPIARELAGMRRSAEGAREEESA
jgi:DNA-binding Xre family transcriptional regulator